MKKPATFALALSSAIAALAATPAFADHNSPMGAGWANMPNDIHDTRIDTRVAEDDAFIEFVQYGAGADTVNRFLTTTTSTAAGGSSSTNAAGGVNSTDAGSKK